MKPTALYVLRDRDLVFGPDSQAEIEHLVDVPAPPLTADTILHHPNVLAKADILITGWGAPRLDARFLDAAPRLRAVFHGAGSVRSFTTPEFWQRGIPITSAYAANAVPVSEFAVASILLGLKSFWRLGRSLRAGRSYPSAGERAEIPGGYRTTVGIVALGAVGRLVCERLRAFDLRLLAHDPYATTTEAEALGVELVTLDDLFSQSDAVSIHVPLLAETENLIRGRHLRSMKPHATFVNTARGALVHEDELIEVLGDRPDLWAVLDVTAEEPPDPASPLYDLPNVVLTPHIAGSQGAECRRMGRFMVEEIERFCTGRPLRFQITPERAALMA